MKNMWLITTTRWMKRGLLSNPMTEGARVFFLLSACSLLLLGSLWATVVHALSPKQIYENDAPGVVLLIAHEAGGKGGSAGTGSIITADGRILTNAHVVVNSETGQPFKNLFVFMKPPEVNGDPKNDLARKVKARVEAFSIPLDLALIRVEGPPPGLPVLQLGDPATVRIGDRVAAIGHPEQGGLWTLTTGEVSAQFVNFGKVPGKHVFQTETGLNRGNSGGPLVDEQGHIVGVNTAIARLAADGMPITSISFAIKSSVARTWLREQGVALEYARAEAPAAPPVEPREIAPAQPQQPEPKEQKVQEPRTKRVEPSETLAGPPAPKTHTEIRPYNMDNLISNHYRALQRELEDMADEMRKNIRRF